MANNSNKQLQAAQAFVAQNPNCCLLDLNQFDLDLDALGDFTAIVNLAGSSISRMPWTARRRADILDSRIAATTTLVEAMTRATKRSKTFVSGSAVGFYGSRGDEILTEQSTHGSGFLADVCRAWEDAAFAAPKGVRVAVIRTVAFDLNRKGAPRAPRAVAAKPRCSSPSKAQTDQGSPRRSRFTPSGSAPLAARC